LDEIDFAIIEALRADGRTSNAALARRIRVAEPTIRKHLAGLVSSGRMQVVAVVDPFKVGYETDTNIGIHCAPAKVIEITERLSAMPEVRYVGVTTGVYDIIIAAMFRSNEELFTFLTQKIANIPGVEKLETSYVLKVVKRTFDWVAPPRGGDADNGLGARAKEDSR
jgi:Lrp/AsnC family transcriptional regulator for asnA, asnC and gidA